MRLIDTDELLENLDWLDEYDFVVFKDVKTTIDEIPTVYAIPIEWIEEWGKRNTWFYGSKDNVITILLREWGCKQRVEKANKILEDWEKENEID